MPDTKKSSSHLGYGLLIGSMVGVAAGLFLQSKKGKVIVRDAKKRAKTMQGQIMRELKKTKKLTKKNYEDVVDRVTDYYVKSKELAKKDVPEIRDFLLGKEKEAVKTIKKTAKKSSK